MNNYSRRNNSKNNKGNHLNNRQRVVDVEFVRNTIVFYQLNHHMVVSKFISGLLKSLRNGNRKFIIDFSNVDAKVYPNAIVPISAIIAYYREQDIKFEGINIPKFIESMNVFSPGTYKEGDVILNKVWEFSAKDVGKIVDAYVEELGRIDIFPKGFLNATEWALNEVMDNVIQHSGVDSGYIMGQIHPSTHHIAFVVFDLGRGIYNSFMGSCFHPRNPVDAITIALQESVTRDKSIGQGNGLFGLFSLMKQGDSRLKITSGQGYYSYEYGSSKTYNKCPILQNDVNMTTVDFMLDYSSDISIEKALVFNGKVYTPISLRLENLENSEGKITINIKVESNGTGTRYAALQLRNKILNILQEQPQTLILNFNGISVISSSYSDELIAKLFMDLGLFQFNKLIRIIGLTREQQSILQKSVIQRIVEDFKSIEISQNQSLIQL